MGTNDVALLQGRHEPATHERCVDLTNVEGEIPQDLNGPHVRNGPNRRFEAPGRYDWFDGDGMPHGLPISAHSKVDERAGEYHFFAYGKPAPDAHYGVMDHHKGGTEHVMTGTPYRMPLDGHWQPDVARFPKLLSKLEHDFVFHEWRFKLGTGQTRDRVIDHFVDQEFPVISSWMQGHKTRYSWNLLMGRLNRPEEPRSCGLVRYDLEREHVPHGFHATRVSAERL